MGKRGYLLLKADLSILNENSMNDQIWNLIQSIENIDGVEYVTNTVGEYDFIVSVDTQESIESVSKQTEKIVPEWIKEIITLTENNFFNKHRELKDLEIFNNIH